MQYFAMYSVLSAIACGGGEITAKVPAQPVEIHFTADGFESSGTPTSHQLVMGKLSSGAVLSVMAEENLPFLSGKDCRESRKGESGFEAFAVGDVAACKFKTVVHEGISKTDYYAWPVTNEYLFIVHASTMSTKSEKGGFDRREFEKIVATFRATGTADRSQWIFPPEVYAFRDDAAAHPDDQLAWVTKECEARADDFGAHFYFAMLASQHEDLDAMVKEYVRAAELLHAIAQRTPQQDQALFQALDRQGGAQFTRKRYREALDACQLLATATASSKHEKAAALRAQALYNIALCQAQLGQAAPALDSLKQAIKAQPDLKERAAKDDYLKPLRSKKEFKALVGL